MRAGDALAAVNACLNGTSAVLLIVGWRFIRAGRRDAHHKTMIAAFVVSCVFLVSYLVRVGLTGAHRYPGAGLAKTIYLLVLLSHMALAIVTPPLAIRALYLALKGRFPEHRRIVRWTLPVWLYVSVTGVVVYLMLYPFAPSH